MEEKSQGKSAAADFERRERHGYDPILNVAEQSPMIGGVVSDDGVPLKIAIFIAL